MILLEKNSVQSLENLPKLPDSETDSIQTDRLLEDRSFHKVRKRSLRESPLKSPSQSSVPLSLQFKKRTSSLSELPFISDTSPTFLCTPTPQYLLQSKRYRSRPKFWDRTTDYQPLYLLQSCSRNSPLSDNFNDLPALPDSPKVKRDKNLNKSEDYKDASGNDYPRILMKPDLPVHRNSSPNSLETTVVNRSSELDFNQIQLSEYSVLHEEEKKEVEYHTNKEPISPKIEFIDKNSTDYYPNNIQNEEQTPPPQINTKSKENNASELQNIKNCSDVLDLDSLSINSNYSHHEKHQSITTNINSSNPDMQVASTVGPLENFSAPRGKKQRRKINQKRYDRNLQKGNNVNKQGVYNTSQDIQVKQANSLQQSTREKDLATVLTLEENEEEQTNLYPSELVFEKTADSVEDAPEMKDLTVVPTLEENKEEQTDLHPSELVFEKTADSVEDAPEMKDLTVVPTLEENKEEQTDLHPSELVFEKTADSVEDAPEMKDLTVVPTLEENKEEQTDLHPSELVFEKTADSVEDAPEMKDLTVVPTLEEKEEEQTDLHPSELVFEKTADSVEDAPEMKDLTVVPTLEENKEEQTDLHPSELVFEKTADSVEDAPEMKDLTVVPTLEENMEEQTDLHPSELVFEKTADSVEDAPEMKDLTVVPTLEENKEEQTDLHPSELVFEKTADSVEDAPEMKDLTVVPTLEEKEEEQTDLHPSELVFEKTADSVEDAPEMKDLTVVPTLEEKEEEQTDMHPSELVFEKTADSVEDAPEMKDLTVVPTLEEKEEEQTDMHPSELVFEKTADSVEDAPEMKDLTVVPTLEENMEEQTDLHPSELVFEKTADSVEDAPEMKDLTVVPTLEEKEEEQTDMHPSELVFEKTADSVEDAPEMKDLTVVPTLEEKEEEQTDMHPSELVFEKTADSVEDAPEMKDLTVVPTLEEKEEEQTDMHPSELVFEKTADSVEDAPEMKDLTVVPTLEEKEEEQTDMHPSELVFEKTADSVEDAPEMKDLTVVPTLEENKEEQTDMHPSELVFEKTADSVEDAPEMKDLTVVPTLEENKEEQTDLHPSELVFEKTADSVEDAPEMKDLTVVPTLEEKEEEQTDLHPSELVFEKTADSVEDAPEMKDLTVVPTLEEKEEEQTDMHPSELVFEKTADSVEDAPEMKDLTVVPTLEENMEEQTDLHPSELVFEKTADSVEDAPEMKDLTVVPTLEENKEEQTDLHPSELVFEKTADSVEDAPEMKDLTVVPTLEENKEEQTDLHPSELVFEKTADSVEDAPEMKDLTVVPTLEEKEEEQTDLHPSELVFEKTADSVEDAPEMKDLTVVPTLEEKEEEQTDMHPSELVFEKTADSVEDAPEMKDLTVVPTLEEKEEEQTDMHPSELVFEKTADSVEDAPEMKDLTVVPTLEENMEEQTDLHPSELVFEKTADSVEDAPEMKDLTVVPTLEEKEEEQTDMHPSELVFEKTADSVEDAPEMKDLTVVPTLEENMEEQTDMHPSELVFEKTADSVEDAPEMKDLTVVPTLEEKEEEQTDMHPSELVFEKTADSVEDAPEMKDLTVVPTLEEKEEEQTDLHPSELVFEKTADSVEDAPEMKDLTVVPTLEEKEEEQTDMHPSELVFEKTADSVEDAPEMKDLTVVPTLEENKEEQTDLHPSELVFEKTADSVEDAPEMKDLTVVPTLEENMEEQTDLHPSELVFEKTADSVEDAPEMKDLTVVPTLEEKEEEQTDFISTEIVLESTTNDVEKAILSNMSLPVDLIGERNNIRQPASEENILTAATVCKGQYDSHVSSSILEMRLEEVKCSMHSHAEQKYVVGDQLKMEEHNKSSAQYPVNFSKFDVVENKKPSHSLNLYHKDDQNKDTTFFDLDGEIANKSIPLDYVQEDMTEGFCNGDKQKVMKFVSVSNDQVEIPTNNCPLDTSDNNIIKKDFEVKPLTELEFKSYSTSPHKDQVLGFVIKKGDGLTNLRDQSGGASNTVQESKRSSVSCTEKQLNEIKDNDDVKISDSSTKHLSLKNSSDRSKDEINANDKRYSSPSNQDYYGDELPLKFDTRAVNQDQVQRKVTDEQLSNSNIYDQTITDKIKTNIVELSLESNKIHNNVENLQVDSKGIAPGEKLYETVKPQETILYQDTNSQLSTSLKYDQSGLNSDSETPKVKPRNTIKGNKVARPERSRRKNLSSKNHHTNDPEGTKTPAMPEIKRFEESSSTIFSTKSSTPLASNNEENMALPSMLSFEEDVGTKCSDMTTSSKANFPVNSATIESSVNKEDKDESLVTSNKLATYQDKFPQTNLSSTENSEKISQSIRNIAPNQNLLKKDNIIAQVNDTISTSMDSSCSLVKTKETVTKIEASEASKRDSEEKNGNRPISKKKARKGKRNQKNGISTPIDEIKYSSPLADPSQSSECNPTAGSQDLVECNVEFYNPAQDLTWGQFRQVRKNPTKDVENQKGFSIKGDNEILYQVAKSLEAIPGQYTGIKHQGSVIGRWGSQELDKIMSTIKNQNKEQFYTSIPNTTDNTVEYEANFLNIEEPKALKPVGLNCVKNQIDTEISQIETVFSFGSIKSASGLNDRNQSFRLLQPSYTTLLVPKKVSKEFLIIKFEIDDKGKEEFRINQYDGTPTISPDKFLIVDKVIANVTESLDINYKIPGLNYQSIDRYLQSEKFEIPCHKFYTEASRHYNGRLYLFNNLSKSSTTGNYIKFQFTTDFKFDLNFNTIESISNFSMGKYLYKIFRAIFETNLDDKTSQKPSSLDDSMQNSKISLFLSDRQSAESFWSFEVRLFSGNSSSNMMQISGLQTNKVLSGSSLNLKSRLVVVLLANQEILQKYEEKIQDFNKKLPSNATNLEDTSFLNRITKKTPEKNRYGANSIEILSFCQENKIRIMEDLYISGQLELPSFSKAIPISLIKSLTIYWSNSSDFQSQSLSINSESKFLKLTNNASITPPNSSIINNGMFLLKTKLPEITEENKCHKITQIPVRITEISKIGALEKLAVTETPINYSEKYKFKSYIQKSCNENELYIVSCQSFESLLESHQGYQSNGEDQSHKSLSLQPSLRMPTSLEKGKLSSDDMEETQKSITTSTSKSLTESQSSSHEIAPHTIHYPSFGKIESFSDPGYSLSHRAEDKYANIRHTPSLLSSKIVSTLNKDLPDSRIQRSDDKIEAPKFIESDSSEYPQERKSKRKTYVELKTFQPKAQNLVAGTRNLVAGTVLERAALQGCAITRKLNVDQLSSSTQTQRSISEVSRSSNCEPASFASTRHNSTCTSFRGSEVQTSRDLRSLSQPTSKLNLTRQPAPPHIANPQANEGRVRVKDMADVFDGVGEGRLSSPRSPTRPPSMRRRQSMKVLDLECKIEQLVEQNRALVEKVELAEKTAKQYTQKAVHEKVVEIESLTQALDWFKKEVSRLKELNEGLKSAGSKIARQQNERIESLETDNVNSGQEIQLKRDPHRRVSTKDEMALQTAISDKNKEIANLCAELDKAKQKIRDLQKQILVSKTNNTEFFVVRDEDYFDKACQQLCQHVQQWVLRFSKFSDMKACRLTDKINNDKTVNRLQSAILDGSDVDLYLSDRIKRRDIFMSIVMTMIWEFIFTRYLFGMDREQRQKLKTLEKILSEVGPASAVHLWRVTTLTLLSRRSAFAQQRVLDTQAVVHTIIETLSEILPPPSSLEEKVREQLTRVINEAANLSVEMRCQKAEYMMLPPLQPEREPSGNVTRKVYFNARLMNERSGETLSNKELEDKKSIVRVVLFPLVVKKGDSRGEGEEETVVCPAQVLVARPKKTVHYSDEVHSRVSTKSSFPMTELGSVV
ncbi:unnamed protein product [Blumeria hordei]|uniref:Uncharacterized protein n=1 Tax=Blumeria hordei TaxID=2867405 RepID=A0A383UT86_BLUHO|nr:unnamed protein product [Blumeria hordei]